MRLTLAVVVSFSALMLNPVPAGNVAVAAEARPAGVTIGVYDPSGSFAGASSVGIEHVYIYWQQIDRKMLRSKIAYAQARAAERVSDQAMLFGSEDAAKGRPRLPKTEPWTGPSQLDVPPISGMAIALTA